MDEAGFPRLRSRTVDRLTDDAVAVTFAVPDDLRRRSGSAPGQHLTLRRSGRSDVRRTYRVCASAPAGRCGWR